MNRQQPTATDAATATPPLPFLYRDKRRNSAIKWSANSRLAVAGWSGSAKMVNLHRKNGQKWWFLTKKNVWFIHGIMWEKRWIAFEKWAKMTNCILKWLKKMMKYIRKMGNIDELHKKIQFLFFKKKW
jgi:hypothetical protein